MIKLRLSEAECLACISRSGIQVQFLLIPKSNFTPHIGGAAYLWETEMGLQWPWYWRNYVKQISGFFLKKWKQGRVLAESFTPRSLREVIINSWDRHHGALPAKPEEKQERTGFGKEKKNWSREVISEDRASQAEPDRAMWNRSLLFSKKKKEIEF